MTETPADIPAGTDRSVWRVHGTPLAAATGRGALDGASVAVKDLFAVAGQTVGAGIPEYAARARPQPADAAAVAALRAAGADIAGLAQTDQFAYSILGINHRYGTPPNPVHPGAVPGGSSSGSATAVRTGAASIGLGTDTAGSIRVPAAYQRLWGIRTTHAAVAVDGLLPLAPTFDAVGWLTRDHATLARVGAVLLPHDTAGLPRAPVRWCAEPGGLVGEERYRSWVAAFRVVQGAEAWQAHGDWVTAHPGCLNRDVADRFAAAAALRTDEIHRARGVVATARAEIRRIAAAGVIALPPVPGPPPSREADAATLDAVRGATLHLTLLASLGGLPAVVVPAGVGEPADAVGVCLLGPAGSDRALIDLAGAPPPR